MIQQAAFEIVGREGRWRWQLRDGETHLAYGAETFTEPEEAREHVNQVRAYLSKLSRSSLRYRNVDMEAPISLPVVENEGVYRWQLEVDDDIVAIPPATYDSEEQARAVAERVTELSVGSVPVVFGGSDETTERSPFTLGAERLKRSIQSVFGRGSTHERFLDQLEARIVVMGIRGKSSTTRRLADVFDRRGYDTLVKITGNRPHVLHNGDYVPLQRKGPRVTLYENIKTFWRFIPVLDSYSPEGVGIFENQGITEYTTRIFNQRFVDPDVIFLTNVRQDHQDTMGKTRQDIARSFARSVPEGAHVVSGEQHPVLDEYMREEVEKVGGTFEQVDVPERHSSLIGAETVHGVNAVLDYLDQDPIPEEEVEGYLATIQPEWTPLPDGNRIFNAAEVNDIESTEAVRRELAGDQPIVPFVYLRGDRRSRTASFVDYVNTLVERGLVETVTVAGDYTSVFAANVDAPVTEFSRDADPKVVLDQLVGTGLPIVLMGNTVAEFMRGFEKEIDRRAKQAIHEPGDERETLPWERADAETVEVATKGGETANAEVSGANGRTEEAEATTGAAVDGRSRTEAQREVLSTLVDELDRRISDEEREIPAGNAGGTTTEKRAKRRQLRSQITALTAYVDALEAVLDDEAAELVGSVEEDVENLRARVESLESTATDSGLEGTDPRDGERERLLREIGEESARIDDVESLNAALSEIRRKRLSRDADER